MESSPENMTDMWLLLSVTYLVFQMTFCSVLFS